MGLRLRVHQEGSPGDQALRMRWKRFRKGFGTSSHSKPFVLKPHTVGRGEARRGTRQPDLGVAHSGDSPYDVGLVQRSNIGLLKRCKWPRRPLRRASACITVLLLAQVRHTSQHQSEGFFNGTAYVRLYTPLSLLGHTGLSFRTCRGGELFSQTNGPNSVSLELLADGLRFSVVMRDARYESRLNARLLDNTWRTVNLVYRLGNLTLSVAGHQQIVANSTYNPEVLNYHNLLSGDSAVLIIGKDFVGCLLEGPSIVFNSSAIQSHNVQWGQCPLNEHSCMKTDFCYNEPCMRHGECISQADHYECRCALRYSGNNCEIDNGSPCDTVNGSPCLNGGTCQEDVIGNYQCFCDSGHTGKHCETEISSHLCESNPCLNNGSCRVSGDKYECTCQSGFMGNNCEININECLSNPCQHGGTCIDGINNYTCSCARTGYTGVNCEKNINECENNPCLNHGICFDNYGSYTCQCTPGFDGQNCEQNLNECSSGPCRNGGHCVDLVGSYECQCIAGFTGPNCEININECDSNPCPFNSECKDGIASYQCVCKSGYSGIPPNCTEVNLCLGSPCQNGGTCSENGDIINCTCPPGFAGVYCERTLGLDWCITTPCRNGGTCMGDMCECPPHFTGRLCEETHLQCSANLCQHATNCQDYNGSYYCECEPGWMGTNCDIEINECDSNPCQNFGTCIDSINNFYCECAEGFTGNMCQINIDECASGPCQNDGVCIDHVNGYRCNCTEDFMGNNCEYEYDVCGLMPCKNNGTCHSRNKREFSCHCPAGFEGGLCEINIDDCKGVQCPENRVCVDGINDYECRCQEGLSGENCTTKVDFCRNKPCKNDAKCESVGGTYSCECPSGFTGRNCENDIDECQNTQICNFGICLNNPGSYQCFCQPGYAGDNCDLDFDECLSGPCKNNATCENKVNSYHCICPPGFTGKDCSREINECEPNPCQNGSTCIDLIAAFSCTCPLGLTGKVCETNIDDCESSPCQNGGKCVDGINSYTCDCGDTGYNGTHCEINIDDCLNYQCQNGARCEDMVKDYKCHCYPGYTGKNCEIDIEECASSPCKYGGTCLERSNRNLYQPVGTEPPVFTEPFTYVNASGYKCLCVPGIEGDNCEKNVNECDPNPCVAGNCMDQIGSYFCECDDGFEGQQCEIDIDECERYRPCVHGTCFDRKANYYCDCDPAYGGKNCSVELIGCNNGGCLNNGTCRPYLENETEHKYNCTCTNGFHGQNCEQITTMSLSGSSYVVVNTTRDEGYDIQFRFKTTLSNGLLAIGKGPTYYILELVQGRLNLHSSLLNKWEGVYIGSGLNDSNWQKVFVAINSSHLVLAANEEQTIYPINLNEGANASHTSFPTTYLGGTISYLRRLAHGPPSLVGCVQDVVINAEWVVPSVSQPQVTQESIEVGCPREPQCRPNPCHNGGHCKDLWRNFSCTCERPFLGHTCQYNLTAATFGYENITSSLVEVKVNEMARRAVQNIVDISMFIRTRNPRGTIFYMGSVPGSVPLPEETLIAAQLEGGELSVRIQFNNTPESYTVGGLKLADGYYHLIQVVRNVTLVQVKINGTEYFRKTISAMGQLNVQVLYLGGMPSSARHIRQVEPTASRLDSLMTQPGFKGIIQDVQISNGSGIMVVEFFALKVEDLVLPPSFGDVYFDEKTVLRGVVSDDTCSSNPCQHNGTCFITWNDFGCKCPPGYKGKMCQEMEFCQLQKCPKGSICQNLDDGYECIANVTFDGHNMSLNYALNVPDGNLLQLDSIKIVYRSHTGGTIMFISSHGGTEYFSVSVFHDEVTIAWNLDGAIGPNLSLHGNIRRFRKPVPDGKWSTVEIRLRDGDIMGGFQDATEEEAQFSAKNFSLDLWHRLIRSGKITLGGLSDISSNVYGDGVSLTHKHSYVTYEEPDAEHSVTAINGIAADFPGPSPVITTELPVHNVEGMFFKGCLGEVRIGGLLLPYFTPEQLNPENYTTQDSFHLSGPRDGAAFGLDVGCVLCFEHECKNGGHCADPAELYNCNCSAGFQGDDCSEQIDECKENECKNGATCIDLIANYSCQCPLGWEGRFCETDIDECASNPCQNGGLCINGLGKFECNCTSEFVGPQCENVKLITCDNSPCANGSTCTDVKNPKTGNNFTCICMEGYVEPDCSMPYCFKEPCQHNGECVILNQVPVCRCVVGYTGRFCEENINDCVDANNASRCQNGGICTDDINNYTCDCSNTGYTGRDCMEDIDECALRYADCGLGRCQNLPGSFRCVCPGTKCGPRCAFNNTCKENPCENGGTCIEECSIAPGYYSCICPVGYTGKNCTETNVETASNSSGLDIALIVAPIVGMVLIASLIGLTIFITMARKKRATRGTYSPSQQEYCNPRVEMDNVMKPPPEERLI